MIYMSLRSNMEGATNGAGSDYDRFTEKNYRNSPKEQRNT
jgi:hypothetical protein